MKTGRNFCFGMGILMSLFILFTNSNSSMAGTNFMKAPLEGGWDKETIEAEPNTKIDAVLIVKPLQNLEEIKIEITLSEGIVLENGLITIKYENVEANKPIKLDYTFHVMSKEAQRVIASVILYDTPTFKLGSAFVLDINPKQDNTPKGRIIMGKNGKKYIVY